MSNYGQRLLLVVVVVVLVVVDVVVVGAENGGFGDGTDVVIGEIIRSSVVLSDSILVSGAEVFNGGIPVSQGTKINVVSCGVGVGVVIGCEVGVDVG